MKKRISALMMCALAFALCSCSDENEGFDGEFNVIISDNPRNLDPQLAVDKQSYYIIRNIYATLVDMDGSGKIVNGAAESYSVSEDGLTYTFRLRDGLIWRGHDKQNSEPLTAYDYEYAFKRIFDQSSQSPHAQRYFVIKNSCAVYKGTMTDDLLGVKAESDSVLKITLEYPDSDFIRDLSHPSASACNEKLFLSTQGRYGLSVNDTFSCGAFYLSEWNYDPYWTDNFITLTRIYENSQDGYQTAPSTVNVRITEDRKEYEKKSNVTTDCYAIDDISEYDKSVSRDYDIASYTTSTTMMCFSDLSVIDDNENAKKALSAAISRDKLSESLSSNSAAASKIIPPAINTSNKSFRELFPDRGDDGGSNNDILNLWNSFTARNKDIDFNSFTMLVSDRCNSQNMPRAITDAFEERLGFYCLAEFEDTKNFSARLSEGRYDLSIVTVKPDFNSTDDYFEELSKYFSNDNLAQMNRKTQKSIDLSEKSKLLSKYEQEFLQELYAVPLCYENEYFLCDNDINDVWYDPYTETVYFKYAKKQ